LTFLPEAEPARSQTARALARALADRSRAAMLIEEIDGLAAALHPMAPFFAEAGFHAGALGLQRVSRPSPIAGRQPAGDNRPPAGGGRQAAPRRPSRSTVSSP